VTLANSWVEPAYVETDASWCVPRLARVAARQRRRVRRQGRFTGPCGARELADRFGRPVRVLLSREDTVRLGRATATRAGVRADGSGVVRVARTAGIAERIRSVAPALEVEEVDLAGPPTSSALRGAGWVEAAVLLSALQADGPTEIRAPTGE